MSRLSSVVVLALSAACATEPTPTPLTPTLRAVSGDGQVATVGDTVAEPLVVQAADPDGTPLPDIAITFLLPSGGGELTVNFVKTDAGGRASTRLVLSIATGVRTVTASADSLAGSPVTFTLHAAPDVPADMFDPNRITDTVTGFTGQPLRNPAVVIVSDRFRNRIPGQSVGWVTTAGGGEPAAPTTLTDENGEASVAWVLGSSPGMDSLQARVTGLSPVDFSALAVAPGPGRIAFTRGAPPNSFLAIIRSDGTGLDQLPGSITGDFEPAWSPDGSKLVFANFAQNPSRVSGFNGYADVVIMNVDGTGRTRLTDHYGSVSGPVWSPDGAKIAFASDRTGVSEVYVMKADGSGVVQLTTTGGRAPAWSPDGTRIAVGGDASYAFSAFVMNSDGSGAVPLAVGEDPSWAPDASLIALVAPDRLGHRVIAIIKSDGSGYAELRSFGSAEAHSPTWSPDGSQIAAHLKLMRGAGSGGGTVIVTFNADGSGEVFLTGSTEMEDAPDHLPAWGP